MNEAIGIGLWLVFVSLCFTGAAATIGRRLYAALVSVGAAISIALTIVYWWKLLSGR